MYNVDEDIYPFGHRQMVTLPKGGGGAIDFVSDDCFWHTYSPYR